MSAKQIEKFTDQPQALEIGYLEVVVMPNGELIHLGKTVARFAKSKDYLYTPVVKKAVSK